MSAQPAINSSCSLVQPLLNRGGRTPETSVPLPGEFEREFGADIASVVFEGFSHGLALCLRDLRDLRGNSHAPSWLPHLSCRHHQVLLLSLYEGPILQED